MTNLDVQVELVEKLLVSFLRAEAGKFGFSRVIVGVSGGIDSAVSAALCARAFGPENVLGVMMPYRTSHPDSEGHARLLVEDLGSTNGTYLNRQRVTVPVVAHAGDRLQVGSIVMEFR